MLDFKNLSKKVIGFGILYIAIKWTIIILVGGYIYQSGLWKDEYLYFLPLVVVLGVSIFFLKKHLKKKKEIATEDTQARN